ncbi:cytochrome P450 [Dentipellis sp. KUC8613]|nr:cytochrome P450 [Dentipellis sp. KUC8613]
MVFPLSSPYDVVGVLVVCCVILKWYRARNSRLDFIPTVGFSNPILSYISAYKYVFDSVRMMQEGYDKYKGGLFKMARLDDWVVVATGVEQVDDIRKAPDDVLSFSEAVSRSLQVDYTLGNAVNNNPYHISIIRSQLTRNLASIFPDVREELVAAFDDAIPAKEHGWVTMPATETIMEIVCRTSNRIFVGAPLCEDPDYRKLNVQFTIDVVKGAFIINRFPDILKPLAGRLFTNVEGSIQRAVRHLEPLIKARRSMLEKYGADWDEKPNDFLMWLMSEAKGDETSTASLARRILTVNFAAIHTSSMSFSHALYHLAANLEFVQPLREEVESIVASEGWTKAALGKMYKVDSFMRESQRYNGIGLINLERYVLKPFTFSNGVTVPAGTIICCSSRPVHLDEEFYPHADKFDPWRFVNMRQEEGEITKHQMVSTTNEFLAFGHGRHACPGRFFAANELKALLAHVVMTYDVKFEDGHGFPSNRYVGNACIPGTANLMFRLRCSPNVPVAAPA